MIKLTEQKAEKSLDDYLGKYLAISIKEANERDIYKALTLYVHDILLEKREEYYKELKHKKAKRVHYLCMEFLLGRNLRNTLFNLQIDDVFTKVLKKHNIDIENVYEVELDPALGNGGLGRLAACFMDSLATLEYPSMGHCILYEYGLFKQKIVDGEQIELTDSWRSTGDLWLQKRQEKSVIVRFGGEVRESYANNRMIPIYSGYSEVQAIPYDMLISGYKSDGVSVLRLWEAKSINQFDLNSFSQGAYVKAVAEASETEMISKVLYPADDHYEGKTLRLKQQYFLVSAALQNIITSHVKRVGDLDKIPDFVAIHINDTHPALCIPELMRILLDDYGLDWDRAWGIVNKTVNYTNHTVLMEALEKWDQNLFKTILPRIFQIVCEINKRFTKELLDNNSDSFDLSQVEKMSIVSQNQVRMANLSVIGSKRVNGVSKLHSDIIKNELFYDFSRLYPDKFTNVTNGITHRRWLCQANPRLTNAISSIIGKAFYLKPEELEKIGKLDEDKAFLNTLYKIKLENKKDFSKYIKKTQNIDIDYNMRFDVQIKRIHEYKRQLLNVLKIIYLYLDLLEDPNKNVTPQIFFFAGKSASKYYMAKRIIELINKLAQEIDKNPQISSKLRVVFLENYNVTLAEHIIPASEISEQISLAGKEASGTGNMKFMINGALTLGTYDGANVEMCELVGRENIFIFGLSSSEVDNEWKKGYRPIDIYNNNPNVKRVIDRLKVGFNGESFADIARYLTEGDRADPYMCLVDFDSYLETYYKMDEIYKNQYLWNKMSLINISKAGFFSSDRSIKEYAKNIWNLKSIRE